MPSLFAQLKAGTLAVKRGLRSFRKKLSKPTVRVAAVAVAWVYRVYMSLVWHTSRIESYGVGRAIRAMVEHRRVVVAIWHDNAVLAPRAYRELSPTTLASRSDIGEVITAVLKLHGYHVFRGGSSRGRSRRTPVLPQLVGHVKGRQEVMLALTVDGSSGPARVCKPGIIALSCETGAPIYATHVACRPALRLPSWDRTRVPLPFGKIVIVLEGPILSKKHPIDADEFRRLREQTQLLLDDTARRAERCVSGQTLAPPDPRLDLDPSYGERDKRVGRSFLLPHEPAPNPKPTTEA